MSGARTGPEVVARQTRTASVVTAGVGAVCTLVAAVAEGTDGLWAGLLGTGVVLAFFVAGLAPVLRPVLFENGGRAGMAVVLVGYGVRFVAVAVVATVIVDHADLHRKSLGLTVMACSLAWVLGAAVVAVRGHVPLDVPDYAPGAPDSS